MLDKITELESNVRGYVRQFPVVFDVARGSELWDLDGRRFIDFFCGAGTLNYGHNNPRAQEALVDYISRDGIQHALDTATRAKIDFLSNFETTILRPRDLDYRVQFSGPTGTNAVEAAIKLAKLATKRSHVIAFTRAYHGHSLGALALTGNAFYHSAYFSSRNNVTHFPFDGYCAELNSAHLLEQMLADPSSGVPIPAAIILETVQGEGGVNVASSEWLRQIASVCERFGSLLIVDDIQVGNGRTGKFFSFEEAQIVPDLVCLSKSIGGGLPMSLVLIRPDHDVWQPGQHTGTFRGNNLAFIAADALLSYWSEEDFENSIADRQAAVEGWMRRIVQKHADVGFSFRGRGLIQGLDVRFGELSRAIIRHSFETGLLIEAAGANDEVLKVMPALTIPNELLAEGLQILERAIDVSVSQQAGSLPVHDVNPLGHNLTQLPTGSVQP